MKVELDGPYIRRSKHRGLLVALALLVALFVLTVIAVHQIKIAKEDHRWPLWFPEKKAHQLMRYHGVQFLKILGGNVMIKRDGRWITVYRAGEE